MGELQLTKTVLKSGVWHGLARRDGAGDAAAAPRLSAWHLETRLDGPDVTPTDAPGQWDVRLDLPASALSDGVQTIVIRDDEADRTLAAVALVAGDPLSEDIRAEVDLLRAELDMLKRAFRRHCADTAG